MRAEDLTPQEIESNDGRFAIKICDEGSLELRMNELTQADPGYFNDDIDWVQTLNFQVEDLDRLIKILKAAKKMNTKTWRTILKEQEED